VRPESETRKLAAGGRPAKDWHPLLELDAEEGGGANILHQTAGFIDRASHISHVTLARISDGASLSARPGPSVKASPDTGGSGHPTLPHPEPAKRVGPPT
jgi:hypothetical protein